MSAQSMSENEIEQFKGLFIAMKPHLELMRRGQLPEELARKFCQTLGLEWLAGPRLITLYRIIFVSFSPPFHPDQAATRFCSFFVR